MWETWVQSLGWEDPLEKGKATCSNILAWRIPWTVKFMGCQRVRHDWMTFAFTFHFILWFLNVDVQPCHLPLYHVQLIFIHGPKLPGSYAILFFTASDCTFWHQPHPQLSFPLWPRQFILIDAISNCPLFSLSNILNILQPGGAHLPASYYFFPFHTIHGILQARILGGLAISLSKTSFCQKSSLWPIYFGDPAQHGWWLHRVMQASLPQ